MTVKYTRKYCIFDENFLLTQIGMNNYRYHVQSFIRYITYYSICVILTNSASLIFYGRVARKGPGQSMSLSISRKCTCLLQIAVYCASSINNAITRFIACNYSFLYILKLIQYFDKTITKGQHLKIVLLISLILQKFQSFWLYLKDMQNQVD